MCNSTTAISGLGGCVTVFPSRVGSVSLVSVSFFMGLQPQAADLRAIP